MAKMVYYSDDVEYENDIDVSELKVMGARHIKIENIYNEGELINVCAHFECDNSKVFKFTDYGAYVE